MNGGSGNGFMSSGNIAAASIRCLLGLFDACILVYEGSFVKSN